ncbi:MAG: tetratricopeptide repeat protein [Acidobacteriota bacterium]
MKKIGLALVAVALAAVALPVALASGGRPASGSPRVDRTPQLTPQQKAINYYNRGLKNRDKAWKHEEKARRASVEKKRQKEIEKAQKQFTRAVKEFRSAVKLVDNFHQAYGSLGYALRRTGQYEEALQAYDQSLAIHSGYVEAIEYRAEAYLGLNRLEDAKSAYLLLVRQDQKQAGKLLEAMKDWIGQRREDQRVDAGSLDEFSQWVAERDGIAQTTARPASSWGSW